MSPLFALQTRLLSANSQNYLRGVYSLPLGVLPEQITFKSLTVRGKNPQEIEAILNQLAHKENKFKNKCQKTLARVQAHLKKLNKWTIGVSLIAVLLLVTVILCALFFPPGNNPRKFKAFLPRKSSISLSEYNSDLLITLI